MNDSKSGPAYRLWSPEGFSDDPWVRSGSFDRDQHVILPLEVFLALDEDTRKSRAGTIAVELQPGEQLAEIESHLDDLPMIALAFPAFSDGRSFSKAELLRSRHGYKGTVRATGEVLIDQIPLMLRTGVTEFEVSDETALRRLTEGRIGGLPHHYQPAARATPQTGTYAWRRQSA
ncbi:MAG: DUF934 domain-containing protein [Rhizobiaceae bacterium]